MGPGSQGGADRALTAVGLTCLEHAYFAGADRMNRVLGRVLPARQSSNMIIGRRATAGSAAATGHPTSLRLIPHR